MGEPSSGGPGAAKAAPGLFTGPASLAMGYWWAAKSATGWRAWAFCAFPWFALSMNVALFRELGILLLVACYGAATLWASQCAKHAAMQGAGDDLDLPSYSRGLFERAAPLGIFFSVLALLGVAAMHLCVKTSGLSDVLGASSGQVSEAARSAALAASGWDGVALPLLVILCCFGLLAGAFAPAPWILLSQEASGAKPSASSIAKSSLRAFASKPAAFFIIGCFQAVLGAASLAVPPLSLLALGWHLASGIVCDAFNSQRS